MGFPNIGLQGFAPKLAKGEIASLSGASDDPRYFQISVPVQPGNSGGALVDERGSVVGVVSAKLSPRAALATRGALPENVNYAVKSSLLLSFLESVPEVVPKLKDPSTSAPDFAEAVTVARHLRERLDAEGRPAFVKTSGKSGLHVVTPWRGAGGYDEARAWALEVAQRVALDVRQNMGTDLAAPVIGVSLQ